MNREQFIVQGLCGTRKLKGEISVKGAKNAVLKSMAASLLFSDTVSISNVPDIEDVERVSELLVDLGASVQREHAVCKINTGTVTKSDLDDHVARTLRASIVFTGPLLSRFGRVSFPHPGGDVIGPRPINLFLDGFKRMGATVTQVGDRYEVHTLKGLQGAEIFFMFVTVTGTETLMMAAVLATGTTVLKNAAMEPEIVELALFLVSCGANITGAGTPTITIHGSAGRLLEAKGKTLRTTPDRIEAGTFLLLGALAAEELTITDCNPFHCDMLIALLAESGVEIETTDSTISLRADNVRRMPLNVRTHEYPGFATDIQPPMVVYLTQTQGESTIFETIWGGRLAYTQDLIAMGANITVWNAQQATIKGPTPLHGRDLESPDIRAGLAFLMAAAIAEGTSTIDHIYHIDRGYERIEERLSKIGLNITRTSA